MGASWRRWWRRCCASVASRWRWPSRAPAAWWQPGSPRSPGASEFLDRGYVTYSNQAKVDLLGVDPKLIEAHGAVSEEVARAMAEGARRAARAGPRRWPSPASPAPAAQHRTSRWGSSSSPCRARWATACAGVQFPGDRDRVRAAGRPGGAGDDPPRRAGAVGGLNGLTAESAEDQQGRQWRTSRRCERSSRSSSTRNCTSGWRALVEDLRPRLPGLRFTPVGNAHLTLRFLGTAQPRALERFAEALAPAAADVPAGRRYR